MKKVFSIIFVLLLSFQILSGCEKRHTVDYVVGEKVVQTKKIDHLKNLTEGFDPKIKGYSLLSWHQDMQSPIEVVDTKKVYQSQVLYGKFYDFIKGEETFYPATLEQIFIDKTLSSYKEFGEVKDAFQNQFGAYIEAEGFLGYHKEDNPYMKVGVAISNDGKVKKVEVLGERAQTEGYTERISEDYLDKNYMNKTLSTALDVDFVTGATITSKAVQYAVWTACNYADTALNIKGDTSLENNAILNELQEGEFEKFDPLGKIDEDIGEVLYSARYENFVGVIVKGRVNVNFEGTYEHDWESPMPSEPILACIIDSDKNKITAIKVIRDGVIQREYFEMDEKLINSYKEVEIVGNNVFDNFTKGLDRGRKYEIEISGDIPIITGTTIIYTGATKDGTFTSQAFRNAFKAVARFYMENK